MGCRRAGPRRSGGGARRRSRAPRRARATSKPSAPVPANRSSTRASSTRRAQDRKERFLHARGRRSHVAAREAFETRLLRSVPPVIVSVPISELWIAFAFSTRRSSSPAWRPDPAGSAQERPGDTASPPQSNQAARRPAASAPPDVAGRIVPDVPDPFGRDAERGHQRGEGGRIGLERPQLVADQDRRRGVRAQGPGDLALLQRRPAVGQDRRRGTPRARRPRSSSRAPSSGRTSSGDQFEADLAPAPRPRSRPRRDAGEELAHRVVDRDRARARARQQRGRCGAKPRVAPSGCPSFGRVAVEGLLLQPVVDPQRVVEVEAEAGIVTAVTRSPARRGTRRRSSTERAQRSVLGRGAARGRRRRSRRRLLGAHVEREVVLDVADRARVAGLRGAGQLPGAAQAQVGLGDLEPVAGLFQDVRGARPRPRRRARPGCRTTPPPRARPARAAGAAARGRKRCASSTTITEALGTSTPTSTTVVATSTSASPRLKRSMTASFPARAAFRAARRLAGR